MKTATQERDVDAERSSDNLPVVQKTRAVAVSDSDLDYLANLGKTDDFKAGDLVVPWLSLVQGTSGYVKRNDPNYNPSAQEGDIVDNLTHRLRASQSAILCRFEVHFTTWRPNGGAIVQQWFTDPTGYNAAKFPINKRTGKPNNFGKKIDADGNEIKPTNVYYILAVDRETGMFTPMVWGLGSTQFGKAKKVNSLAREMMMGPSGPFVPPIYARLFDLTSTGEQGEVDGQMKYWSGWVINPGEAVLAKDEDGNYINKYGKMWIEAAVEFRKQVLAGSVRPAEPEARTEERAARDDDGDERDQQGGRHAATSQAEDDDIPF